MSELRTWLTAIGLEQHAELFESHEVDLATLRILTDADLQELGLPFGPRKRLRHALRAEEGSDIPAAAAPTTAAAAPDGDGERRQLTVLFCDMVGFTELASRVDPEVLRAVIRRYEDICAVGITRYDGYVFQRLGDGIVAFFGFPLAHEGEAERAVRAALEIVETLAAADFGETGRVQVRVGIATGVVVVSAAERSAVGETMNLASRLQGLAQPGEIVASDRVRRLAGGTFTWSDLGERALKGIATPTRAWRVEGINEAVSRFEAATGEDRTPFVGREAEMRTLLERWALAREGQGQVGVISGEAGIGKSRMVSGVCERLAAEGVEPLRLQCSPFQINSALHPFLDHLARTLGFVRGDPPATRFDRLDSLVIDTLGHPREDAAYLAALLALPWRDRYTLPPLSPRRMRDEGIRALLDLFAAKARAHPTLLLVEDVHWADPSTLEVLGALVERVAALPLLVLVTHRPEFGPQWGGSPHVVLLDLSRLDRAESRSMVERLVAAKPLPPELVDEIVEKADGIPLFVEELTKSAIESGELMDAGDRYTFVVAGSRVALPATLRDSLMARLDRVTAVKEVAQVGAAFGREFSYDLLAAVSPMTPVSLNEALDRLTDSGLAFRVGAIPDAHYTFKHALVQDVAYDSLLKSRRQELHRAIAHAIEAKVPGVREHEPELLARHFTAATMAEAAVPLWRRAGELAMQRLALPEAIAHVRTGLGCVDALPGGASRDRMELGLRTLLGPAVVAHRGWAAPEVSETLEPAWRLNQSLGDHESSIPVLHGLWVHFMTMAQLTTSLGWAERMLDEGRRTGDEGLEICGHRAAMTTYFWMGRLREAHAHGDQVLARYDASRHGQIALRTHSDPLTGDGIYRAHYLWMLGYPDQARRVSDATVEHARRRNHPFDIAFALTLGAQSYEYCGDAEHLLAGSSEAVRIGREYGVPLMSDMMAEISRGVGLLLLDQLDDGIPQLDASIDRLAGTGHRVWVAYLGARLGAAHAKRGDAARGLAIIDENLTRADCREDRVHRAEMLRLRAEVLAMMGRRAEAMEALHESLRVARAQEARGWELRTATTLARLLGDDGDTERARALLGPAFSWFTEGFDSSDLRTAARLLDELRARGDGRTMAARASG